MGKTIKAEEMSNKSMRLFQILCKNTLKPRQMGNFLENKNLLKLIPVETDSPNINYHRRNKVIKGLPYNKAPDPNGFMEELYQTFKNQITSMLLKSKEKEEKLQIILNINKNNNLSGMKLCLFPRVYNIDTNG